MFTKVQFTTFTISANFKILQFLNTFNKSVGRGLKDAKVMILSAF